MTKELSTKQIRLLRLRSQRLHPEAARSISGVAELVKVMSGLQAQELPSATLAVRPRSIHLVAEDVKKAREEDRSIVLTWCMRGVFIRKSDRRYKQLELDQETRKRAVSEIRKALSQRGPLIRTELAEALAAKGIPVEGQAIAHLVRYAALEGVICFGPEHDGQLTYVLLDDWIRPSRRLDADQIQAELARRYLEAYGPAAPDDLASWSGISIGEARAGFEAISNDLLEVQTTDSQAWMLASHSAWLDKPTEDSIVRLLPRYDAYLLGYQSRAFMVSAAHAKRIHPGGGQIKSTLIVDGRAAGIWSTERKKHSVTIVVEPFEPISPNVISKIEAEAQDIGRFMGQETQLRVR
ncbi:MAG: winged helix DNA-binding domain-containing protein [Anaerolineales bacterium]